MSRAGNVSGRTPSARVERVPGGRGDRGEHRVGCPRARRPRRREDRDAHRRHVAGADDAERPDRQVVHLAGFGIDRDRLGEHPAQRHVHRADRVRPQHDLVERITGRRRRTSTRRERAGRRLSISTRRARRRRARASSVTTRSTVDTGHSSAPATSTACSAKPAARSSGPTGGPGDVELGPRRPHLARRTTVGQHASSLARHARRRPRSRPRRRATTAVAAIGGRFGPEPHDVFARVHDPHRFAELIRELRAAAATRASAPCRRTRRRSRAAKRARRRARTTTRRVRGTRARPTTSRAARRLRDTPATASGGASSTVVRRPCTFPAAHALRPLSDDPVHPGRFDRTACPSPAARTRRARRVARCRRRSPRHRAAHRCIDTAAAPPSSAAAAAAPREVPRRVLRPTLRSPRTPSPAGAPAEMRGQRLVEVGRRVAAARMMMPGVQKPHCDPPVATNAAANRRARAGRALRSSSPIGPRPAAAGVTHATRGVAVDEHRAAPALALRRAAVLRRRRARAARAAPRAATRPARPRPRRRAPLQVNVTRSVTRTSGSAG